MAYQKTYMRFTSLTYFKPETLERGTRVLMRLDANVDPADSHPVRITRAVPEIEAILAAGGRVMLMTHRGRPKGREATLSTKHLVPRLEALLERPVVHVPEFSRAACDRAWRDKPEAVILFENLRFFDGEEKNGRAFARDMASVADLYLNNAFGVSHRKHASVHRITKYIPSFAGSLIREEVAALNTPFEEPFAFVLGGAKMETKIPLLRKLAPSAAAVLLGSAFVLPDQAKSVAWLQRKYGERIHLPIDIRVQMGEEIHVLTLARWREALEGEHAATLRCLDIGPETEMAYAATLLEMKSVLWNGPLGIVEEEEGKNGTLSLIDALQHARQARVVIGGGDTIELIQPEEIESHMFLSTGGGATLTYLSGAPMPGLRVLQ